MGNGKPAKSSLFEGGGVSLFRWFGKRVAGPDLPAGASTRDQLETFEVCRMCLAPFGKIEANQYHV